MILLWRASSPRGRLKRVRWEGPELAPGKHVLEFDFKYDGLGPGTMAFGSYSGIGQPGTGVLKVDGKDVATQKMEHTVPFILQWDESLDIGSDTGTPVDDDDYQTPFTFTGKLNKITLTIDRPKLSPEDIKRLQATAEAAADGLTSGSVAAASEAAELHPTGDTPTTLVGKIELLMDKREICRKQADAKNLGFVERMRFMVQCMR
jgi:arylsulfatase